jgi:hypothetical protein
MGSDYNHEQDRKTAIYKELVSGGSAQLRPGVKRLIDEVHDCGVKRIYTRVRT